MKDLQSYAKLSVLSVLMVGLLGVTGCDTLKTFGKFKKDDTKPAKLVRLTQNAPVLSRVTEFSLPKASNQNRWRIGGSRQNNKKNVADLSVVPVGQVAIAASRTGVVSAYDGQKAIWSMQIPDASGIASGVSANEELVVVGTRQGKIVALSTLTGEIRWQKDLPTSVLTPALIGQQNVIVSANDGLIYALNKQTGELVWQFGTQQTELSVRGTATPIAIDDKAVLFGMADGRIHAIAPDTGKPLWTRRVGQAVGGSQIHRLSDVDSQPLVAGQYLYVVSYSGQLLGFDMSTGQGLFASELKSVKNLTLLGNQLIGSSIDGDVVAFDAMSGQELWKNSELKNRRLTNPVTIGSHVAVGDYDGVIHVLDSAGKIVSRVNTKGALSTLTASNNRLYAQSANDVLSVWQF